MSKKLLLLQLMLCEDTDGYFVIQLFPVRPTTVCSLINASLLDTKRRD